MRKQNKHDIIKDKAIVAKQNEKVINDFLLQFAYKFHHEFFRCEEVFQVYSFKSAQ